MMQFIAMGGFGVYVWSAYGVTLGVLLWLFGSSYFQYKKLIPKHKNNKEVPCTQFVKNV